MSDIGKIDSNLAITETDSGKKLIFRNVLSEPFSVYGLLKQTPFLRLPEEVAKNTNEGVFALNNNTAGGRVRFKTNSNEITIRAIMPNKCLMPHMAFSGSSGFDMYIYDSENYLYTYNGTFMPPTNRDDSFESFITMPDNSFHDVTINFPLYDGVKELYIGTTPDSEVLPCEDYRNESPIIFYGSSITQGGCASRPGNSYQAMISRRFNCDYINLGFSGNAKGEQSMAEYIASQKMALFFMDYDHNANSAPELQSTHEKFFLTVREKNPNLPIIIASKTDIPRTKNAQNDTEQRRNIIFNTYNNAVKRGDKNVEFIDGASVFKAAEYFGVSADSCTVDGCHPNDLGFSCMAKVFGDKIAEMLNWNK